ncbi:interleukin-15 receptor subunit alpha isoform X1 [Cavia porcellus]|uniref:interleukin-15 receptor subunit alpha isoform X1 n=1 Tax=Cavia porcellus TaxID=10141 RepID=UPI000661DEDC|nr:interleukin-15 receptor subunit alpha isoform X1 [Cavia porcellus]
MVPRQLRGCRVHALRALQLLLLLLRPPATLGTTCPTPTSVEHADIQVKSYNLHSRERYVCNSGFKRKAGTSSLTECVFNKSANIAHWTTPNLKCIRDPSLTHQKPVPPSTIVTARVTPEPESPSPAGKEPAALSPKSATTLATETATVPGPWLMASTLPSVNTTGLGSHEPSQTPSQTTAMTLEHMPSTSHETPGAPSHSSRGGTAISTSVAVIFAVIAVLVLVWYFRSRNIPQPRAIEMETVEAIPMAGDTSSREEDTGRHSPLNL